MPRTAVGPARHRRFDPDLAVQVRGVHGYLASCDCGFEGRVRDTWGEAAVDAKVHRGWHKMQAHGL
jgi:hypothetical protein